MLLEHEIQLVAFGKTEERHIIHYFFRGSKYILQLPLDDVETPTLSQYQAIELAAKAEQDKINKTEVNSMLHPVMRQALRPYIH